MQNTSDNLLFSFKKPRDAKSIKKISRLNFSMANL